LEKEKKSTFIVSQTEMILDYIPQRIVRQRERSGNSYNTRGEEEDPLIPFFV